MTKDSIILVVRIGVQDGNIEEILNGVQKAFEKLSSADVTIFYLPEFKESEGYFNIECINPKLVTADTFKEAEEKLKELNSQLETLLKKDEKKS